MNAPLAHPRRQFRGIEHLTFDWLEADAAQHQRGGDAFDGAPFPDGGFFEAGEGREPAGAFVRVSLHEFHGVFAHDHAEVVFGFREKAVRVDELEAVAGLEGVRL